MEAQGELNNPRVERTGNLPEVRGSERRTDSAEVRVIKDIEQLTAEFEGGVLANFEVFIESHIERNQAGSRDDAIGWRFRKSHRGARRRHLY